MKIWLVTAGSWHLPQTAQAYDKQDSLAALWMSDRNKGRFSKNKFKWCWPVFAATKPLWFIPGVSGYWAERLFWDSLPIWQGWFKCQSLPECDVVQARMGYAVEPFQQVPKGVLKVLDCANSHPTTQIGYWQRELDIYTPGLKPVVPDFMFSRMNREIEMADILLCPSTFVKQTMTDNGIPEEKCFVNPFGFEQSIFTPRKKQPSSPRFIFTGTLALRKGIQYLFQAFDLVKKEIPSAELVMVGGVNYDAKSEVAKWRHLFTHISYCKQDRMVEELHNSTAYMFPSCEEGFARSVIEAMACEIPVIASHESGATTLIEDKKNGLIVKPRDVNAIAEAMLLLAKDSDLNIKMGTLGHQAVQGHSWQQYGNKNMAYFSKAINKVN